MRAASSAVSLVLLTGLVGFPVASNPTGQNQTVEVLTTTDLSFIDCVESAPRARVVRSASLVPPDRRYRAYAEVETRMIGETTKGTELAECANRSRLFIGNSSSRVLPQVYEEEPTYWMRGNGLRLVDWSADSRYLLVELWRWQYYSDTIGTWILVYDREKDLLLSPDLNKLFSRMHQRECWLNIKLLGFASDNRVAFEAEDDMMIGSTCLEKKSRWLLEPVGGYLMPIPEEYKLSTYGKLEQSPHKK